MTVKEIPDGTNLTLALTGRLDTNTSPELEKIVTSLTDVDELVLDFAELEYVSSAGLRVILKAHKQQSTRGGMKLRHVNDEIREVLDITGFLDILEIE